MFNKMKEKMNECKKNNKGFTLMELIVVVAILGFLIAMLAPKYMNYTDKAMGTAAAADVRNIQSTASAHLLDNGTYADAATIKAALGITAASGDKVLTTGAVATANTYTYVYTKGGVIITSVINIDNSTTTFAVTGSANLEKRKRVAAGIGSNYLVDVK